MIEPEIESRKAECGDRARRAWATVNEREREEAEREGRDPQPLSPITLHECRHTFASLPGTRDQARQLVDAYIDAATAA